MGHSINDLTLGLHYLFEERLNRLQSYLEGGHLENVLVAASEYLEATRVVGRNIDLKPHNERYKSLMAQYRVVRKK